MRQVFAWLILLIALGACSTSGGAGNAAGLHGRTYLDSGGWAVTVPRGWHAAPFSDSLGKVVSAGVQLSNIRLPAPAIVPGAPIQATDRVMPDDGISLIIATDKDLKLSRSPVATLPLPSPNGPRQEWAVSFGGGLPDTQAPMPYIEVIWFRVGNAYFIASAKISSEPDSAAFTALDQAIQSIRSQSTAAS